MFCRTKSVLVKPIFCVLTAGYSKMSSRRTPSAALTWMATPFQPSAVDHCCSRCRRQVRRMPSAINADSMERLARGIADPVSHSERMAYLLAFLYVLQHNLAIRQGGGKIVSTLLDADYLVAAAAATAPSDLAYLRRKRSTRPAVSTRRCLPVKNGWQAEQIST